MIKRERHAKIVATLGPASCNQETIAQLYHAGADVFRLNFSHGTHEDHRITHGLIRAIEAEVGRPIGILLDLQGPKLRVGTFEDGKVTLKSGQSFTFDQDPTPGNTQRVCLPHPEIFAALNPGDKLLLDDGLLQMTVDKNTDGVLHMTVGVGGVLSNRKGVNVPTAKLPLCALTEKDKVDLAFGLTLGVDWVALSFVQTAHDIEQVKAIVGDQAGVLAKLEKPQAIEHLESVIAISDAIMVARGDLGVEMAPEDVPSVQKAIIRACLKAGKPVIVATQMLDSMVRSPTPTRAEASDVATAIYDGVDAVMLSAESASGKYPIESVAMMDRIIKKVEADPIWREQLEATRYEPKPHTSDAITAAARQIAATLGTAAIVTFTCSGFTTLSAARERPSAPILGITPNVGTARKLTLAWGTHAFHRDSHPTDMNDMTDIAIREALLNGFCSTGNDRIVITAGMPFGTPGGTNLLRITRVPFSTIDDLLNG
jgi:pyruvate kinase